MDIEHFDATSPRDEQSALRHLHERVTARADVRTNIITVTATARYPVMSRDLLATLLKSLDSVNISLRQSQSRDLREFFESRVRDAQRALDSAENALRIFLERNRVVSSPLLQFEHGRLLRIAEVKRTVLATLMQQYEEAKIQESRDVPILSVLASPNVPARKSGPPRRLIVVATIFLAMLLFAVEPHLTAVAVELRLLISRDRANET